MAEFIFTMKGVTKVHPPDKKIIEDLYLSFLPNAKIGVIGVNGTGKSSLLRIMAGVDDSFTGEAWIRPGAHVGYLPQEPDLGDAKTVLEAVEAGVSSVRAILDEFNELSMKLGEPMSDEEMAKLLDRQGALQDKIDAVDGWNLESTLEIAMDALRLPPADADPKTLSGGEKRRVALCRLLLEKPELLLLDEPTNHLDAESVAWLQGYLQKYPGCVILVTHDRYFLDEIVEWILELDRGEAHPFQGNYSQWLEAKEARLAQEEKKDSSRKRKIARELEWVRSSPKAQAGQEQGPHHGLREPGGRRGQGPRRCKRNSNPPGAAAGHAGVRAQWGEQGLRRQAPVRRPELHRAARGDRRHRRPERCRQDDLVPNAGWRGDARLRDRDRR